MGSVKPNRATLRGTWVTLLGTVCGGGQILPAVSVVSSLWLRRHIGPLTSIMQSLSLFLNQKLEGCLHVTTSQICYHFSDILWFNIVGNLNCNNMVCFPMGLNYCICILSAIKGSKNVTPLLNHPWEDSLLTTVLFYFSQLYLDKTSCKKQNKALHLSVGRIGGILPWQNCHSTTDLLAEGRMLEERFGVT